MSAPPSYTHVIFDMDGTIFDTEPLYHSAYQAALAEQNLDLPDTLYYSQLAGTTNANIYAFCDKQFGTELDIDRFKASWPDHLQTLIATSGLPLMPGIIDLIQELSATGVPMAIASSSDRSEIEQFLKLAGIRDHFSHLAAGDEVENSKPSPEIFQLAVSRLGTQPEHCIAIEDSNHGVAAAHAAGIKVIMKPDCTAPDEHAKRAAIITDDVYSCTMSLIKQSSTSS